MNPMMLLQIKEKIDWEDDDFCIWSENCEVVR